MAGALVGSQLVLLANGDPALLAPFTVWDDEIYGTNISAQCTAPDGLSAIELKTSTDGLSPRFRLPDDTPVGYIDINASARQLALPAQTIRDAAATSASVAITEIDGGTF